MDAGSGVVVLTVLILFLVVEGGFQLIPGGQLNGLGPGALPILTGKIGDSIRFLQPVVDVRIRKAGGNGFTSVEGLGISTGIRFRLVPGIGQGGAAVHVRSLGGQDVIHRVMGAAAYSEIIIPRFHDIGAITLRIKRRQPLHGYLDCHGFRSAGCQFSGLFKTHQLYGGFFNQVLFIVFCVGGLAVYLYHFFASYSASVGYLHLNSGGVCGVIEGNTLQFLSKRGIAQAISKGVQHILFPGPAAEGGVALIQYTVLVAGLIILVVLVNAFGIHHVGLRLGGHDFGGVGIAVVAVILHRGGGVRIHSHRFHRAAGRRGFARDHIRQAVSAAVASVAQVQDCADFRISLQRSHFGIKVTAEQNHDLARRRFRLGDQGKLLGSQSQAALRHVSALSGGTSDDH